MPAQQHLDRLEPFLDDDETMIDGYAAPHEMGVLTDRQLLTLASTDDETTTIVNATYLDRLGGAKITHETPPELQQDRLVSGIVSLFVALVSLALFGAVDSDGPAVALLVVGLGVGIMGLVLLFEAYDTPDPSVRIELQTGEGDVAWQTQLDEEHLEFAEAVSRTVSNAHAPAATATQTVGR